MTVIQYLVVIQSLSLFEKKKKKKKCTSTSLKDWVAVREREREKKKKKRISQQVTGSSARPIIKSTIRLEKKKNQLEKKKKAPTFVRNGEGKTNYLGWRRTGLGSVQTIDHFDRKTTEKSKQNSRKFDH